MNRKIKITGVNKFFFIFVLLFMIFQIVILPYLQNQWGYDFVENNIYGVLLINQYGLILIPLLIFMLTKRLSFKEVFRFNKLNPLAALIIVFISIPAYFTAGMLNAWVRYFLQFLGDVSEQPLPAPKSMTELGIGILVVAVTPAICEEMMHRGLFLKAYEKRGTLKAIVFTAFFFGIFHFDITNFFGPVVLGAIMAYYVVRTNSIFAGMLAHFLNNTIAETFQYLWRNEPQTGNMRITMADMGGITFWGLLGIGVVFVLLQVLNQATKNSAKHYPPISSVKNDILSVFTHWPIIIVIQAYLLVAAIYILFLLAS